jgi:predicted amidohydrolase
MPLLLGKQRITSIISVQVGSPKAANMPATIVEQTRQEMVNMIRIAMCQIVCLDGDRRGNLARIEHAVAEAAQAGADIACLPESVIYGWVNPDTHQRAHPIPGEDSQRLCEIARRHRVFLCVGLDEKDGEHLYDSAVLIDDTGRLLLKHRKHILLSELMTPPYAPGQDVAAVPTRLGRIGVLICADTHENAILERMAQCRPDLLLVPYGYAAEEEAWPRHARLLERVVTNAARVVGAPVIGTNLVGAITHGPWTGRTYAGHSVAADKTGQILALGRDFDRDIVPVTLALRS